MILVSTFAVGSSSAATFVNGDVFAAVGNGRVQQWRNISGSMTLLGTLNTTRGGYTTGMAFDSAGRLYVTNFSDGSISRFNNDGTLANAQFVSGINTAPESIVFDASGNFYVGSADGLQDIYKFNSSGSLLSQYNVATTARGADWIDLASDGKTMFYTSENYEIHRYDVSTNTQLANFATLPNRPAFALRLLADGGLLVADSAQILRLNSAGAVVQSYDVAGHNSWFALNLDGDGKTFWSGDSGTGQFHQFDIASGALLESANTGSGNHFGLTVYGETTAAVPTVPDGGATVVFILGGMAVLIGVRSQRTRQRSRQEH